MTPLNRSLLKVEEALDVVLLGKREQIRLALACLLANGHLLIEDVPGVGKTTLALGLAKALDLSHQRVQFTVDVMPSDITGSSIYRADQHQFEFQPGPVFSEILLADEINRAMPKTQSALLEAMEEGRVSQDGKTYPLPVPFFVIATQNPITHSGTFALPESQKDRFLMRLNLGYPDQNAERDLFHRGVALLARDVEAAVITRSELLEAKKAVQEVNTSNALVDYVLRLVRYTRSCGYFTLGLSPRAGLGLLSASRAWAWLEGRDFVMPEDVQAVFVSVAGHRLQPLQGMGDSANLGPLDCLAEVDVVA
jgi:MoxR-like ATPase